MDRPLRPFEKVSSLLIGQWLLFGSAGETATIGFTHRTLPGNTRWLLRGDREAISGITPYRKVLFSLATDVSLPHIPDVGNISCGQLRYSVTSSKSFETIAQIRQESCCSFREVFPEAAQVPDALLPGLPGRYLIPATQLVSSFMRTKISGQVPPLYQACDGWTRPCFAWTSQLSSEKRSIISLVVLVPATSTFHDLETVVEPCAWLAAQRRTVGPDFPHMVVWRRVCTMNHITRQAWHSRDPITGLCRHVVA